MTTSWPRRYRFAIQGGPFGDPAPLRDHARRAEDLGYVEFYSSDHIGAPGGERQGGAHVVDPFIPLIVASEATSRLGVGPLVLNNEFYNPALLARTAATVDRLTDGRLVLGLGTGYAEAEHAAIGSPIRPPGTRVSRLGESLAVLRSLLDTGTVDHAGTHVSVHFDDVGIEPSQGHVPFLIGGHGRRVVELAGQYADVYQFTGLTHGEGGAPSAGGFGLGDLTERAQWLDEAAGDRNDSIERSALVQLTSVGDDATSYSELADQFEMDAETIEQTPFVLAGSVAQVVDKIERLRERLGITHYVVRDPEGFAPIVDALGDR